MIRLLLALVAVGAALLRVPLVVGFADHGVAQYILHVSVTGVLVVGASAFTPPETRNHAELVGQALGDVETPGGTRKSRRWG